MKTILFRSIFLFIFFILLSGCISREENRIRTNGAEVVSFRVLPFELNQVKLLDGPFLLLLN
jgi:hypothetical protein